jgi:hypothetical protein
VSSLFSCQNEQFSSKVQIKESELKKSEKNYEPEMGNWRERCTHYPVPSGVKVGKKLEMTSRVDMM